MTKIAILLSGHIRNLQEHIVENTFNKKYGWKKR